MYIKKSNVIIWVCLLVLYMGSCKPNTNQTTPSPLLTRLKINETDCFRCFGGNYIIEKLATITDIELVFNGLEEATLNRFLQVNNIPQDLVTSIINDTSTYNSLNTYSLTEAHVCDRQGNEYLCFPFKEGPSIDEVISEINVLSDALSFENNPLKLDLSYNSSYQELCVDENYILVLYHSMNLCDVFDKSGTKVYQIDAMQIDPSDVFPEMKSMKPVTSYLKDMGMFSCRLEKTICNGKEVLALVNVPYVEMQNDSISQNIVPCIFSFFDNGEGWKSTVLYNDKEIWLADFTTSIDNFGLEIHAVGFDYKTEGCVNHTMYYMTLNEGKLHVTNSKQIVYPTFERIPTFGYKEKVKDGLFSLGYTDYLYNFATDSVYKLPIQCNPKMEGSNIANMTLNSNGHVVDWAFDGTDLSIVYFDENNKECQLLQLTQWSKDFTITPLSFGSNLKCPYLYLDSPYVIYYLNADNQLSTKTIRKHL